MYQLLLDIKAMESYLYNALVISVLLCGSETWILLKADERQLEAFHMNCQRQILGTNERLSH